MTFGPSASTGAVLEEFSSPCDGSSITEQVELIQLALFQAQL